jgi:5-methylcytosine-specific restriction endonuclease McrA
VANEKDKFRSSHAWTIKRNEIVARDQYLCQWCKTEGQYTHEHLEVHHIVPLEEDYELRLDNDNLITLCEWHHEWAERGQIERSALITIAQR